MIIVTLLGRDDETAGECCSGLQRDGLTALRGIKRRLEIAAFVDGNRGPRRGRVSHGALHVNARQLGRAVEVSGLRR